MKEKGRNRAATLKRPRAVTYPHRIQHIQIIMGIGSSQELYFYRRILS